MLALGARDKIVGVDTLVTTAMPEFGLKGLPEVSRHGKELDYENILKLKTDLIVMTTSDQISENADKLPNVAVIDLSCMDRATLTSHLKTIGYVLFITPMENNITGVGKTEEDLKGFLTQTIDNFPEFKNVNAVKNNRVYLLDFNLFGPRWIIGNCYYAKWLHPDRFKDIHPDELHKEYFLKFHNMEVGGTWAYPPPE